MVSCNHTELYIRITYDLKFEFAICDNVNGIDMDWNKFLLMRLVGYVISVRDAPIKSALSAAIDSHYSCILGGNNLDARAHTRWCYGERQQTIIGITQPNKHSSGDTQPTIHAIYWQSISSPVQPYETIYNHIYFIPHASLLTFDTQRPCYMHISIFHHFFCYHFSFFNLFISVKFRHFRKTWSEDGGCKTSIITEKNAKTKFAL